MMFAFVGRDFFPAIDGGQIQLHVRAPAGTRIETTERIFQAIEDKIREVIPERERSLIVDNIGLPARSYNLAFTDGSTIGANDGAILVALKEGHAPTADYVRQLRVALPEAFPEVMFYFQAADIVTQILTSACRPKSTCALSATTGRPTCAWQRSCGGASRPFLGLSMLISSRRSMPRRFMRRSIARAPPSLVSTRPALPTTSTSASVRPSRSHPISGPTQPLAFPTTWQFRHRSTG